MAKLENVKVIEATDGEITKVEHGGTMFNKAEGEPQAGDLVYTTMRISDTKADSFYEVVKDKKDPFEGMAIIDEAGDECFTQFPGSVRFKKEAESGERSVNVGDKIRITDPHPLSTHRYKRGDVFTVKYHHPEDDVHYEHIYVEGVGVSILPDEFEVIEEEDEDELRKQFSPGDKVRLLNGGGESPLLGHKDGNEYVVVDVNYDLGTYQTTDFIALEGGTSIGGRGYALPSQLEPVEEEDTLKIGDRVEIVDTTLYILHANQRTGTIVGYADSSRGDFEVRIDNYGDSLGFFNEELTKLEEEEEREYQEGDVVRITEDHAIRSRNKAGDIGVITEIGNSSNIRVHVHGNGEDFANWQNPGSIELVAKAGDRADLK